ncbi:FAD:protein FMN transferase [Costertonia aggregata]|uniref:FAD:protein FMN transferase n=1 Tax=Costertonia aggregata TaxID=343403 RepID=A0A7H9ALT0_9FLAO|nr:FAD:protein FMN transferase [Costertonia aggregata]QLG44333.1 FAD:protein FMN transferase [Costertonia aggregata]
MSITYKTHRICFKLLLALLAVFSISSCSTDPVIVKNQNIGAALGTSYSLIYLSNKELDYQKEIDSVFTAVNKSLSTYIPDSDISRINMGDTTVVVDAMFKEVFKLSKNIAQKTNGYFDPTVGTLVNAWGFGPGKQIEMDSVKVDSLMQYVGLDKVGIDQSDRIVKKNPNIYFDFNAIAKGYAIDRLGTMFDKKGIEDYLLEVGGEIVAKGKNKLKAKPWLVAIDDPQMQSERKAKKRIYITDRALASSGNYRHFRVDSITGKKHVHTVNPKTGFTKNSNVLGVTILADNCAVADGYATAFMAMDLDESIQILLNQKAVDAYIIYLDQNGETKEFMTNGFETLVVSE